MVNKKDFNKFTKQMWNRLKEGEKKYGTKYQSAKIINELLAEAVDLSNYSLLLYLQAKETKLVKGGQNGQAKDRRGSKSNPRRNR